MHKQFMKLPTRIAASLGGAALFASLFSSKVLAATPTDSPGLLVNNYWGQPMTLDIAGTQYTIPADGHLLIALTPGVYDLSANVNGIDKSATTAEITLNAGEELQMSAAENGTFFQPIAIAQQPALPATTLPATGSPALVSANTDPGKAVGIDSTSHSIAPNQSLWYRFDLSGSNGAEAILSLAGAGNSGLQFQVYSAGQIGDWWDASPVGVGNVDDYNNLVWATNVDMDSAWFVRVMNNSAQTTNFQFTLSGPVAP